MKKLFAVLAAVSVSYLAQADWLLWQVTFTDLNDFSDAAYVGVGRVAKGGDAETSGQLLTSYSLGGVEMDTTVGVMDADTQAKILGSDLSANYAYYVEIFNDSGDVIGRTKKDGGYVTYESLANNNYIFTDDLSTVPQANVWHGGSFEAVPEPSSMALLALGAGLVGLRRKLKKGKKGKCA